MKNVKYVGFYDSPNNKSDRVCSLPATNKMDYVASAVKNAGYEVEIVSPSWMGNDSVIKFEKQKKIKLDEGINLTLCPSWITKNKITTYIKIVISLLWLFFYLMKNVKRNETILAYHVQWISIPIRVSKFLKGFDLILEVEEIYGDVWEKSEKLNKMESKLINSADSFIFVSDNLKQILNSENQKKDIVLYGSYNKIENINHKINHTINKNTYKLVYAGSIDATKGGAYKAVEALSYLPDNYTLHILGSGSNHAIDKLENMIEEINHKKNKKICNYEGILHGQEYSNYLLQCDIALNPQKSGNYMKTAFPSKIISYLSHNLYVVSTKIKSIENSSISEYIYFSNDDNPKSIAETIMRVKICDDYNSKEIINKLDEEFIVNIKDLLENK